MLPRREYLSTIHIKDYLSKTHDYAKRVVLDEKITVSLCSIQSEEKVQQDALDCAILDGFQKLTRDEREHCLKATCKAMQAQYGKEAFAGSTINTIVASMKDDRTVTITYANIGHSASYILLVDNQNKIISSQRMNVLHDKNLTKDSYHVNTDGLIGFNFLESVGLNHKADVDEFELTLAEGHKLFLVTASHGLTNAGLIHYQDRQRDIASSFVEAAFQNQKEKNQFSNISVAIAEVKPGVPFSLSVFDGEGVGAENISKKLSEHFYATLQTITKEFCKPKLQMLAALLMQRAGSPKARVKDVDLSSLSSVVTIFKNLRIIPFIKEEKIANVKLVVFPNPFAWIAECLGFIRPEIRVSWLTQHALYNDISLFRRFDRYRYLYEHIERAPEVALENAAMIQRTIHHGACYAQESALLSEEIRAATVRERCTALSDQSTMKAAHLSTMSKRFNV